MTLLWNMAKRTLFSIDAERAHRLGVNALSYWSRAFSSHPFEIASLKRECFGLQFPNPLGIAAGFDKDAECVPALQALGFGFIEVGSVTAKPQAGNPKPRLFRLPLDRGLMNRLGFNNAGAAAVAARLEKLRKEKKITVPIGINIGKSKIAPLDEASADYLESFRAVADVADYVVINISSPNTPGLRDLQEEKRLTVLLEALMLHNQRRYRPRPLLLKLSPDLDLERAIACVDVALSRKFSGIIVSNTTVYRENLVGVIPEGLGGISGRPLFERSTELLRDLKRHFADKIVFIGVGGIMDAVSAREKLDAGADLLQVYTGFVYGGPGFPRRILESLTT